MPTKTNPAAPDITGVWQIVIEILPHLASIPKPDAKLRLEDCGLDSMSMVNLILRLEEVYGVSVDGEQINSESFKTADSICRLLKNIRAKKGRS